MGGIKSCCNPQVVVQSKMVEEGRDSLSQKPVPIKKRPLLKPDSYPPKLYFESIGNEVKFQELITNYKANERKFKHAVKVNLPPIEDNRINEVFYIRSMNAFYIGEWGFDNTIGFGIKAGQNVPNGIGRLYESEYISEGQFQTKHPVDQESGMYIMMVVLQGKGRKFNKNQVMQGDFENGVLHGIGIYKNKEKNYAYEGKWQRGKRHGKGQQTTKTYHYNGDFKHDVRQGKGVYTLQLTSIQKKRLQLENVRVKQLYRRQQITGDKAQKQHKKKQKKKKDDINDLVNKIIAEKSQWKNLLQQKSLFENETFYRQRLTRVLYDEVYNGSFQDDMFHGQGMYTWHTGKVYRGTWEKGKMNGQGEFIWANNVCYRGGYKDDLKHGKGEIIWNANVRWRGTWAYGMRHGYGQSIEVNPEEKLIRLRGSKWDRDKEVKIYFKKMYQFSGADEPWRQEIRESMDMEIESQRKLKPKPEEEDDDIKQFPSAIRKIISNQNPQESTIKSKRVLIKESSVENSAMKSAHDQSDLPTAKTTAKTWMRPNFFDKD